MAQKVKTDWILFVTILGMVAGGLLMLYSASSVVAERPVRIERLLRRSASWVGRWWRWRS